MSNSSEEDDRGFISDDELPEDLRPSENPLARNPEDDPEETDAERDAGVPGMPDLADPSA